MAALVATRPTVAGVATAGAAVASSDTVALPLLGNRGAILEITNGNASPDSMTISDAGATPSGSTLTGGTFAATVANATSRAFRLHPSMANPTTGVITITHSVTATVTYKLYPLD
jgi:hypothetical protein